MVAGRNPFPIPDVTTEGFWIPPGPVLGDKISIHDKKWSSRLEAHERLFAHQTLNSIRRNHRFVRTQAPTDALDLALTSTYAHNDDTLVPKMYVYIQPESLGRATWRVLRNELKTSSSHSQLSIVGKTASAEPNHRVKQKKGSYKEEKREYKPPATRAASAPARSAHKAPDPLHRYAGSTRHVGLPDRVERIHPSSLKLAIEGPHTDRTNPGYSRTEMHTKLADGRRHVANIVEYYAAVQERARAEARGIKMQPSTTGTSRDYLEGPSTCLPCPLALRNRTMSVIPLRNIATSLLHYKPDHLK